MKKINLIAKAKGREDIKLDNKYEVTSASLCKSDTEYNPACVKRTCKIRGDNSLKTHFMPLVLEEDKTIYEWNKWGSSEINGKKKPMLLKHTGSVQDSINELCRAVDTLAKHLFVAQWQYKQFLDLTKQVQKTG